MTHPLDIPLIETLDDFACDPQEIRDLLQTTPPLYDADGLPVGYDAEEFFGLEGTDFLGPHA
jgi:hypothetical protein